MDFDDLIYIRYDEQPPNPDASESDVIRAVTGKDEPAALTEEESEAVEEHQARQERLAKALSRFWTWVRYEQPERDGAAMLHRLDQEMRWAGFRIVDRSLTGLDEVFTDIPDRWR